MFEVCQKWSCLGLVMEGQSVLDRLRSRAQEAKRDLAIFVILLVVFFGLIFIAGRSGSLERVSRVCLTRALSELESPYNRHEDDTTFSYLKLVDAIIQASSNLTFIKQVQNITESF
jgi:hypothetical protein